MKPKSRKSREIQQHIAECLRTGLPLAGLISTLLSATGCDRFFAPTVVGKVPSREEHVVGDMGPIDAEGGEKQAVDGAKPENPVEDAKPEKAGMPPPPPGVPLIPKVDQPIKRTAGVPPRSKPSNIEKDAIPPKTE